MKKISMVYFLFLLLLYPTKALAENDKSTNKKNFHSIFDLFKESPNDLIKQRKIELKIGPRLFYTSNEEWKLKHIDKLMINLKLNLLGKYLSVYGLFSTSSTNIKYVPLLDEYTKKILKVSFAVDASGSTSYGFGINLFLLSYKKFSMYGFFEIEVGNQQNAEPSQALITYNKVLFDITRDIQDSLDINYSRATYTYGALFGYRLLPWMWIFNKLGYAKFQITTKVNTDTLLLDRITGLTGINARSIVPRKLSINMDSMLALFGLKFRLYKSFYFQFEGTLLPISDLTYYLQASLLIRL